MIVLVCYISLDMLNYSAVSTIYCYLTHSDNIFHAILLFIISSSISSVFTHDLYLQYEVLSRSYLATIHYGVRVQPGCDADSHIPGHPRVPQHPTTSTPSYHLFGPRKKRTPTRCIAQKQNREQVEPGVG